MEMERFSSSQNAKINPLDILSEVEWLRNRGVQLLNENSRRECFISRGRKMRKESLRVLNGNSNTVVGEGSTVKTPLILKNNSGTEEILDKMSSSGNMKKVDQHSKAHLKFASIHLLTIIVVLLSSGLILFSDVVFVVSANLYAVALTALWSLNNMKLPLASPRLSKSPTKWLSVAFAYTEAFFGLIFPLTLLLGGISRSDYTSIQTLAPHIFFVSCHFMSEIAFASFPIALHAEVMLSITYSVRCFFSSKEWHNKALMIGAKNSWQSLGYYLALMNMAFWSTSVLCFYIPFALMEAYAGQLSKRSIT